VATHTAKFDKSFLEAQRRKLTDLRHSLLGTKASEHAEEGDVNAGTSGEAREFEDDAQKLTTLELEGTLEARDTERLVNVERALRKIEDGTYGISDVSGEPIPRERLEVVPEAIYTLAEQSARDQKA
jgi:DnaK suppressor protein